MSSAYLNMVPRTELQAQEQIARARGALARYQGRPIKANPYDRFLAMFEHSQWIVGYETADENMANERQEST